jgi:hypothetical protein
MNYIRLAIASACVATVGFGQERDFDAILKDIKDAAVPAVAWSFEKTREYPQVPGLFIAGVMRAGKQAITQKPASFMFWALLGSTFLAEACKITATNYLYLQNNRGERCIKEHWLEDLKAAHNSVVKTTTQVLSSISESDSGPQKKD